MVSREQLVDTFVHMPPGRILGELSSEEAERRLSLGAHTIAEITAHMIFWQEWFTARCEGRGAPMASTASIGWPAVASGAFESLRDRFLAGAELLTTFHLRSSEALSPPIEFPPLARYTIGDVLVHVAQHNSHHLGQIVTLRQLLTRWPPPGGGWTW